MLDIQQFASRMSEDPAYRAVQSDQQAFFFVNSATIRGEALTNEDLSCSGMQNPQTRILKTMGFPSKGLHF